MRETRSVLGWRVAGLLLAGIGLGPWLWSAVADAQVRRSVLVDPLLLIAACVLAASIAPDRILAGVGALRGWLLRPSDRSFPLPVFLCITLFATPFACSCF